MTESVPERPVSASDVQSMKSIDGLRRDLQSAQRLLQITQDDLQTAAGLAGFVEDQLEAFGDKPAASLPPFDETPTRAWRIEQAARRVIAQADSPKWGGNAPILDLSPLREALALPPQPAQKTEETVGLRADLRECDAERKAWKSRALKAEVALCAVADKKLDELIRIAADDRYSDDYVGICFRAAALSVPREPGGER